jgi:hypothetical protein
MKAFKIVFTVLVSILVSVSSFAQGDDFRRLEDNITALKAKIRTSNAKDPKDIQKLYKLENELEKKIYLQKNRQQ